jgi:integral membrane protein (TIGR00529 family)
MIRELGDRIGIRRERSAAINYMFRHQWETVWPLFPAVPLVQSTFGISAFALISHNAVISAAGTIGAVIFLLLSGIPRRPEGPRARGRFAAHMRGVAETFWPIAVVAVLYAGFDITPAGGLLLAVVAFLALHKVPFGQWRRIFRSGFEGDFVLLIFGALLFKLTLESGRAVPAVVEFLTAVNAPAPVLIFGLPMLVAFLTGVTMPTVAITFPFLLPYVGTGEHAKVALETLAFSGLICGLMATPVHLCLALSASYFETGLWRIVRQILWPIGFVAAAGVLMAIFST